jgi:hypothetical protein
MTRRVKTLLPQIGQIDLHVRVNPKEPATEGRGFETSTKESRWAFHGDRNIDVAVIHPGGDAHNP